MGGWIDDGRSALRSLRRSPGFAAFSVGTLALGIGATITFASFFDRIVLHPVDFPGSDRVVIAWRWQESRDLMVSADLETRDRVRQAHVFSAVAAVGKRDVAWSTDQGPRMLAAGLMDTALPALAGVSPVLGRFFDAGDVSGSGAMVAVVSEGLWRRAFGGDPAILGRAIRIEGEPRTVIGVAPDALRPPSLGGGGVDAWLPLAADGSQSGLTLFARLRDGVTLERAQERMKALDLAAAEADPSAWATRLMPVAELVGKNLINPLKVAGAAVALLLLIACINVANLLLARSDARTRDTAVRAAVGAGQLRLARETLFESLVIAGAASLIGLGLAVVAVQAVLSLAPADWTLIGSLRLDPAVTTVAVAGAVFTVLLFGLLPLGFRARTQPRAVLTQHSGTADRNTLALRRLLLVGEVTLSFGLLVGGIQVVGTLEQMRTRDPGLAVRELLAVNLQLPDWRFPDAASKGAALRAMRTRIAGLPGVSGVTAATGVPPHSRVFAGSAAAEGHAQLEGPAAPTPDFFFGNEVTPGYFGTVGQTLLAGRTFTEEDLKADPAPYILGESAAKKYFPQGDAVGGHFRLGSGGVWHSVIGVVRDTWASGAANDFGFPQLYLLLDEGEGSTLVVRTEDPSAVAADVRAAIRSLDSEIPILDMHSVASLFHQALARERLIALLLAAFAVTAVILVAVGLYGVVSQLAVRRTREFGIRMSLGAEPRSIFALATRSGVSSVGIGLALGGALAWTGIHFLEMNVAGLAEPNALAFLGAAVLLILATLTATSVPALRAARTDAIHALRVE